MPALRKLLDHDPKLAQATDRFYGSQLHLAAAKGRLAMVKLLVERGADLNLLHENASSPLHAAAGQNATEVVKFLIGQGADVNAQFEYVYPSGHKTWGYSPLDFAAGGGHVEMAKLLMKHGAKLVPRPKLRTPLHMACTGRPERDAEMHKENPGNRKMIAFLVEQGVDVNAVDFLGETPLVKATRSAAVDTVRYLLEECEGVEVDRRAGLAKATALGYATSREFPDTGRKPTGEELNARRVEIVKLLLEHGADPTLKTRWGQTAISAAKGEEVLRVLARHLAKQPVGDDSPDVSPRPSQHRE